MAQEYIKKSTTHAEEETTPQPTPPPAEKISPTAQKHIENTEDLLADIDAVLEANAEEFVKGFVQKGGE